MKDILTDEEIAFLRRQGLDPDDVFDARGLPQWLWFKQIDRTSKRIALGSPCRRYRHRLRSRRGHCVQCDTSKLAFQERYRADQYVYIAGSRSKRLIKIGTARDEQQRERQMRSEQYGGAHDWRIIFSVKSRNAGAIEDAARAQLYKFAVAKPYQKNGATQLGKELLRCSFSQAKKVLLELVADAKLAEPWESIYSNNYEFAVQEI